MLALTKYSCQQNTGVDKILASTKYSHQQNVGVSKICASTKSSCWQNFGACVEASPYCLAWQSPQQLTSPRPRWCSPMYPRRCWSLHMQSPSVPLPLGALLLWADSLTHCCTSPPCRKRHKYWCWQILAPAKISLIFAKLSAHLLKIGENKKWSPSLSNISLHTHKFQNRGHHRDPMLRSLYTAKG